MSFAGIACICHLLSTCLSVHRAIHPSAFLPAHVSVRASICLSACSLHVCLSVYLHASLGGRRRLGAVRATAGPAGTAGAAGAARCMAHTVQCNAHCTCTASPPHAHHISPHLHRTRSAFAPHAYCICTAHAHRMPTARRAALLRAHATGGHRAGVWRQRHARGTGGAALSKAASRERHSPATPGRPGLVQGWLLPGASRLALWEEQA